MSKYVIHLEPFGENANNLTVEIILDPDTGFQIILFSISTNTTINTVKTPAANT